MKLSKEQRRAVSKALAQRRAFIWWKPGEGKTRVALAYFAGIAKRSKEQRGDFLVVCRRIAFQDWIDEARLIGIQWKIQPSEDGVLLPHNGWRIVLASHGMLPRKEGFLKHRWIAVAFDEGFLFKNPRAERTKCAAILSFSVRYGAVLLSGSVMTAKDPTDIYGQAMCLGLQHCLARTLTEFRTYYMNKISMGAYNTYVPRKDAYEKIAKKIAAYSDLHFPEGRPAKHIVKKIDLHPLQITLIENLKNEYYLEYEEKELDIKNALSLAVKVQQISNGWINIDGETKELPSAKLDYLKSLVEELHAANEQVIIWTAFRYDIERIKRILPMPCGVLYGGVSSIQDDSKKHRVVIATEASGSSINAFKDFRYAVYFSTNYSWLDMQQSRHRTDRKSSKHEGAVYYYLLGKQSLDEAVLDTATTSGNSEKKLLTHVNQWLPTRLGHSDQ